MHEGATREVSIAGYCFAAARQALELAEQARERSDEAALADNAIVAIVMTAAACEASLNTLIARAATRRFSPDSAEAVTAQLFWERTHRKPAIVAELVGAPAPDLDEPPYTVLEPLFRMRNELMHGRPRVLAPSAMPPPDAEADGIPDELFLDWETDDIVGTIRDYIEGVAAIEAALGPPYDLGEPLSFRHAVHFSGSSITEA
jgi:hypothetical protein